MVARGAVKLLVFLKVKNDNICIFIFIYIKERGRFNIYIYIKKYSSDCFFTSSKLAF